MKERMRAIVFGATGMVGEGVLHQSLLDSKVESVLVIGRRSCETKHQKLKELIHHDFYNFSAIENQLRGFDACFFCLGVSSIGMNEQEYSRVTYDLTMCAARTLVKLNPGMRFCYVSGVGTDSTEKGRSMWARVKGKTENDLTKLPFSAVYAFRPGFIKPIKGLKNTLLFAKALGPTYPVLNVFFPKYVCTLEDLGLAMLHVVRSGSPSRIVGNEEIAQLAKTTSF